MLEQGQGDVQLLEVRVQVRELLQVLQEHEQGQVILSWASLGFLGFLISDFEDRSCRTDCLDWSSAVG